MTSPECLSNLDRSSPGECVESRAACGRGLICASEPSSTEIARDDPTYLMQTFFEWVARVRLLAEHYVTFDLAQCNQLFDEELEKVTKRTRDPAHRQILVRAVRRSRDRRPRRADGGRRNQIPGRSS